MTATTPTSRIPADVVQQMREAVAAGENRRDVGERLGYARTTVYKHTADLRQATPPPPDLAPEPAEVNTWRDRAACRGVDPEVFFPEPDDKDGVRAALRYCTRCPVRTECLQEGLQADRQWGVWGGLSEGQRRAVGRRTAA